MLLRVKIWRKLLTTVGYSKMDKFPDIEQSLVFQGYYQHATSRTINFFFQNLISASLISGNSGNESFCGINWMRNFSSSVSGQNVFEKYYLIAKSEKNLCCER